MADSETGSVNYDSVLENFSFYYPAKSTQLHKVTFDTDCLVLSSKSEPSKNTHIPYHDIIGCKIKLNNLSNGDAVRKEPLCQILEIYCISKSKALFSKESRKKVCHSIGTNVCDSAVKNISILQHVKEEIEAKLRASSHNGSIEVTRFSKPILLLVNPTSGRRQARKSVQDKTVPLLKYADMPYKIIETEIKGHATEIVATADLNEYYGIVIASGDGLLFEVIQGLMQRSDCEEAIHTPLGVLPCGSGNALSCSINFAAGELYKSDILIHASFVLLKHTIKPMDLMRVDTHVGKTYHSFLSVTWGVLADVDIESERFRTLGNARFTVEALFKIMRPRRYQCKLQFKPVHPYVMKGRSETSRDMTGSGDHNTKLQLTRSRSATAPPLSSPTITSQPISSAPTSEKSNGTVDSARTVLELPPLDQPVPSDWVTVEKGYTFVVAQLPSHLGPDLISAPSASLNDGLIHLVTLSSNITRMQAISVMGELETGKHISNPLVECIPVYAFRLTPKPTEPAHHMVVDGEEVDYGPIQATVLPSAARVMAL